MKISENTAFNLGALAAAVGIVLLVSLLIYFTDRSQAEDRRQHPEDYLSCAELCAVACRPKAVRRTECGGWGANVCECAP